MASEAVLPLVLSSELLRILHGLSSLSSGFHVSKSHLPDVDPPDVADRRVTATRVPDYGCVDLAPGDPASSLS